jgi:hypothetical protein
VVEEGQKWAGMENQLVMFSWDVSKNCVDSYLLTMGIFSFSLNQGCH